MSVQDYIEVEQTLFSDDAHEGDDIDYFEKEVSEVVIPDPEEASKKFIEKFGSEGVVEEYENIDEDEENAYESFSPIKTDLSSSSGPIVIGNIVKEKAETDNMFNTRQILYERIMKIGAYSVEECDVYSRVITNKLWYNLSYSAKTEKVVKSILESI
jgi:hypothetical protein